MLCGHCTSNGENWGPIRNCECCREAAVELHLHISECAECKDIFNPKSCLMSCLLVRSIPWTLQAHTPIPEWFHHHGYSGVVLQWRECIICLAFRRTFCQEQCWFFGSSWGSPTNGLPGCNWGEYEIQSSSEFDTKSLFLDICRSLWVAHRQTSRCLIHFKHLPRRIYRTCEHPQVHSGRQAGELSLGDDEYLHVSKVRCCSIRQILDHWPDI